MVRVVAGTLIPSRKYNREVARLPNATKATCRGRADGTLRLTNSSCFVRRVER